MKKNKLSIITASLDQGQFIEECIKSVKSQTYPYIEHIIMDGGSTDNTLDIIKKYAGTYNLRWKSEKDRRQSHAFNKTIKIATGDWLLFINSDDFLLGPTVVEDIFKLIEQNPGNMVYMANIRSVDKDGALLYLNSPFKHKVHTHNILMNRGARVTHQGTIYNKQVFKTVGGYDEKFHYHMDYEFHLRLLKYFNIYTFNMYLAALRNHTNAKTQMPSIGGEFEMITARLKNGGSWFHKMTYNCFKRILLIILLPSPIKRKLRDIKVSKYLKELKKAEEYSRTKRKTFNFKK